MNTIDPKLLSISFTDKRLCTRCGTCIGVCPTAALTIGSQRFPALLAERCTECGLCRRTCPGGSLSFSDLSDITFGHRQSAGGFDGHVIRTYVGYARDEGFRRGGAGGGVITALLGELLKSGAVDGCIVTRMSHSRPWVGEPFIARTYEDLLASQGSKYSIIPLNSIFLQLQQLKGRFALAALPCQMHGYRLMTREIPELREKVPYAIGLFCGGALEPFIVPELLAMKGLGPHDIKDFQFRGGEWPGKIRAVKKNGDIVNMHYSNYKDGGYNYFVGVYMPKRCQTCIDGSCEYSDLSVSDVWTKDEKGRYKFNAHSKVLIRTDVGNDILSLATSRGAILAQDVTRDSSYRTHQIQTKRKGIIAPLRVARYHRHQAAAPAYDRPPPESSRMEVLTEIAVSSILWLGSFKLFRYPLIKFLTSSWAIPLIDLRLFLKRRKYRKIALRRSESQRLRS